MSLTSVKKAKSSLGKARQVFLYVAPFPALVFFKIWISLGRDPGSLFIVAGSMLAYCSICLALALRWDKPTYFDWAIWAYFLAISLSLVLWKEATAPILVEYAITGVYLCLFGAAFLPPILRLDPFTYHYAKKLVPQAFWSTPVFANINRVMTFVWAGIFAICGLLSLYPSSVTRALVPISMIVGLGIPFNLLFPDYYLKSIGLPTMAAMRGSGDLSAKNAAAVSDKKALPDVVACRLEPLGSTVPPKSVQRQAETTDQSQSERSTTLKVIAINSSPRADGTSKTGIMLEALVGGMREAGAEVETVHLRQKVVKNCIGCFTCWTKTPGICVHKDDMTNELFPKWLEADIAVYATPLYHYTMNATMKAFVERSLPTLEPFFIPNEGGTRHPLRHKLPQAVVISVAGFPELAVFDQLSSYVRFLFGRGLLAELYRPAAEVMKLPEFSETSRDILSATADAGRDLVQSRKISNETMERITQPIVDPDSLAKMANMFWKSCIQEGLTPKEFERKNLVPRPDSVQTFMMIMSRGFNPLNAAGSRAVIQFDFSGEIEGACSFRIENGLIEAKEGRSEKPDLTIQSPFDIWMDIVTGKSDGQQMFMEQKYKAIGDLSLLIRMKELFGNR
ncbi:MAG: NAD(P)H-dependent oxidoreductase [Desulfomonile tiedjei]|uniref:NAD(P)H-dependent oxidoreductase n=1 Tax=Desulfomonile tiedjei TaxID=2358 RepID=A0A9D6Z2R4_9BACT|nr:NAD(P)H-dependent oxidoreductase [Desulfomonile tiedjei]